MSSKIRIICVGKVKEKYLNGGMSEYMKRLSPFVKAEVIELKDEGVKKDSEKLLEYVNNDTFLLDEKGKDYASLDFAKLIKNHIGTLTFIIGGPDGTSDELKSRCKKISLSKMTFTHEMARLFLIEQIYRAYMINNNRQYHR